METHERELAEGHPLFRHVGLVTVTASDLEQLEEACTGVEQAAAQSLVDLRPLVARQAEVGLRRYRLVAPFGGEDGSEPRDGSRGCGGLEATWEAGRRPWATSRATRANVGATSRSSHSDCADGGTRDCVDAQIGTSNRLS